MNHFDNIKRSETAILFGLVLSLAIVSWLFIYSFRHIPLTNVAGGEEPLYALVGGVALAFSVPTLPLLVLYVTVLFSAGKNQLPSVMLFLLAFVTAFVVTIGGVPYSIASTIYNGKTIINIIGGILLAFYGLKALNGSGLISELRFLVSKSEKVAVMEAACLGLVAGLLLFHHLDPFYDSVFFLTGRAGAASHHPLSVSSFGLGLTAMYIALAYGVSLLTASRQVANDIAWLKGTASILSLILGLSFATGTFPSLVGLITKGH